MNRHIASLALLFCVGCVYSGDTSLGPCKVATDCTRLDGGELLGATCNDGRCAYTCSHVCDPAESCDGANCVLVGPKITSVNAPTTWALQSGTVTVTAMVNDTTSPTTNGPGIKSATLRAGGNDYAGSTSDTGFVRTYTFTIPGSLQPANTETPIDFTITATDQNGGVTPNGAAGRGQLLIDAKGPTVNGVTVNGGVAVGPSGQQIKWFAQSQSTPLDVQVSIQDAGSGVLQSSLALMAGATRIDSGTPTCTSATAQTLTCHFSVVPSTLPTAVIPAGGQRRIQFAVAGTDVATNSVTTNTAALGVDGKAPAITFTVGAGGTTTYPVNFADCNGGASDAAMYCGHDGSHFWRQGDGKYNLSFTASDTFGMPDDVGSGVDSTSGTCAITGSTTPCVVTFTSAGATFHFPADFSTATFASGADGTGTVQVSVNVKDLVGNPLTSSVQVPVSVTRLKWMRTMTAKVDTFKASPIATSVPVAQAIFVGTERTDALGPIASFAPDGTVLWRAGHGDVATISNNIAYSSTTHNLYVLGDNVGRLFGYRVDATSASSSFNCPLTDGTTGGNGIGSPAIVSGTPERVLLSDSVGRLWSLAGTPGSGCATVGNTFTNNGGTWSALGTPTFSNGLVYLPHNVTKLSTVAFNGSDFGAITDAGSFSQSVFGPVAVAGNLFFANQSVPGQVLSFTPAFVQSWSTAALLQDRLNAPTVVSTDYAFASSATNDGQLHALLKGTGAEAWHWATGTTKIGNVSAPTFGADGVVYFSSDNPTQLIPLKVANGTPTLADGWAEFRGSTAQKTTSPVVDTTLDSVTTEPVIDSTGAIWFGTAGGKVFVLITDSGGLLAPALGSTWPRVSYDNCNSANAGFVCQ